MPSRCRAQGSQYDRLQQGGSHMPTKFSLTYKVQLKWKMDNGSPTADPPKNTSDGSSLRAWTLAYSIKRDSTSTRMIRAATQLDWQHPAAGHCSSWGSCLLFIILFPWCPGSQKASEHTSLSKLSVLAPVLQRGSHQSYLFPVPLSGTRRKTLYTRS